MYYLDSLRDKDGSEIYRTKAGFRYPLSKDRNGQYKVKSGEMIRVCMTSDFFLEEADAWRSEAWQMIRTRSELNFFLITKRPDRFYVNLPEDWGDGYENVAVSCTCESQYTADLRLPVFLELPIRHKSITHEPMLQKINIRKYLREYGEIIESVSCGGESGPDARPCDYAWVMDTMLQCVEFNVSFFFHQTGANFIKGGRAYNIERKYQHQQAEKAGINYTAR